MIKQPKVFGNRIFRFTTTTQTIQPGNHAFRHGPVSIRETAVTGYLPADLVGYFPPIVGVEPRQVQLLHAVE